LQLRHGGLSDLDHHGPGRCLCRRRLNVHLKKEVIGTRLDDEWSRAGYEAPPPRVEEPVQQPLNAAALLEEEE